MLDPLPKTSQSVLVRFKYTVLSLAATFEWSDSSVDKMEIPEEDAYQKLRRIQANGGIKPG